MPCPRRKRRLIRESFRRFSHIGPREVDDLITVIEEIPVDIDSPVSRLMDMLERPGGYAK